MTGAGTSDRRGLTYAQKLISAGLVAEAKTAGLSPQTPKPERDEAIRRLAGMGATDADMARLFCLSENGVRTIRLNLHTRQLSEAEWELVQAYRAGKVEWPPGKWSGVHDS